MPTSLLTKINVKGLHDRFKGQDKKNVKCKMMGLKLCMKYLKILPAIKKLIIPSAYNSP